jgi:hypothetical protein
MMIERTIDFQGPPRAARLAIEREPRQQRSNDRIARRPSLRVRGGRDQAIDGQRHRGISGG